MQNRNELISLSATRQLLKSHWYWQLSDDTVKKVKNILNELCNDVAIAIIRYHIDRNEELSRYGLRPKSRLTIYKNFSHRLLKAISGFNIGESGQDNRDTDLSKANMEIS